MACAGGCLVRTKVTPNKGIGRVASCQRWRGGEVADKQDQSDPMRFASCYACASVSSNQGSSCVHHETRLAYAIVDEGLLCNKS